MKKTLIVLLVLISSVIQAQEKDSVKYLIKNSAFQISGFGGIISESSFLRNSLSECVGAAGALSFNHYLYIGAYGLNLSSNHNINDLVMSQQFDSLYYYGKPLKTSFNHAGLWLGAVFFPKKKLHLGINARIGWGSIRLIEKANNSYINNVNYRLDYTIDKVFVFTPQIDLDISLTSWLKCTVGVGYRFVSGVSFDRYKDFNFSTPQVSIGLFFGGFFNRSGDEPEINNTSEETEE